MITCKVLKATTVDLSDDRKKPLVRDVRVGEIVDLPERHARLLAGIGKVRVLTADELEGAGKVATPEPKKTGPDSGTGAGEGDDDGIVDPKASGGKAGKAARK